jgi:hypothetical protein
VRLAVPSSQGKQSSVTRQSLRRASRSHYIHIPTSQNALRMLMSTNVVKDRRHAAALQCSVSGPCAFTMKSHAPYITSIPGWHLLNHSQPERRPTAGSRRFRGVLSIIDMFPYLQTVPSIQDCMCLSKASTACKHETAQFPQFLLSPQQVSHFLMISAQPSSQISQTVRGRPRGRYSSIVTNMDALPGQITLATLQGPFEQPNLHFMSATLDSESRTLVDDKQQDRNATHTPRSSCGSSFEQLASPPLPAKKARYYSYALSDEDKEALARSEMNYNLKGYTPKDMVLHHESRKSLVSHNTNEREKIEAIANIEREKQYSQQAMNKKVRRPPNISNIPRISIINEHGHKRQPTYRRQASQSMYDLRSSSAPAPQLSPPVSLSPPSVSPSSPSLTRTFSFDASPPESRLTHIRASSNGNYFSSRPICRTRPERLRKPSSSFADTPNRVRSPLVDELSRHQHNPEATFDAFLVPHRSGKGEVFRGSDNAKKNTTSKNTTPISS